MILVVSKYFGYNVGGAERSMEEILKRKGEDYIYIKFHNLKHYNAQELINNGLLGKQIGLFWFGDFRLFPFTGAILNTLVYRKKLKGIVRSYGITEIYAYGFFACAVLGISSARKSLFIRDESAFGELTNYHRGSRYFIYKIYQLLEFPGRYFWKAIMRNINWDTVFYNSRFMQNRNTLKLKVTSEIVRYPQIDLSSLITSYNFWKTKSKQSYITFVGDSYVKGIEIFKYLVEKLDEVEFLHIGEVNVDAKNVTNWNYCDIGKVFASTSLLLVPSQWQEAYGRIVREAVLLGIPTVASNTGGISEAADSSVTLINSFKDGEVWLASVKEKIEYLK